MIVKKKSKVTKTLIAASFFITIIAIATPVLSADPNRILMIDIMAKGDDSDISGATTSIIAKIKYDKASGIPLAQVEFQTKIYDESGEKIYSMKGKLNNGFVNPEFIQFYCEVREVWWINLWHVMGVGVIKTTDADLYIEYRGYNIKLPNTKGQYIPFSIWMMVNPKGEYYEAEFDEEGNPLPPPLGEEPLTWPEGGWATAIIIVDGIPSVGVVTYLTKYMEKVVP